MAGPRHYNGSAEDSTVNDTAHNTGAAKAAMNFKDPEMGAPPAAEHKTGGVMGLHGSSARLTEIVPTGESATPSRLATPRAWRTTVQSTLSCGSATREALQHGVTHPAS